MSEGVFLGFDVGSVFLKAVAMAPDGRVAEEDCRRANGRPLETASVALRDLLSRIENARVLGVATTGGGGEALAEALGGCFVNEIIALSVGIPEIAAGIRTAIDIGGQDSKLLLFAEADGGHCPALVDFSMNSVCAAGTGSFLDQQATRLGVAIEEEFGRLALLSEIPPRIAGRCSVFAKSDMIHLQQIATPVHDIIAGLCLALARGFKSTVGKGKEFLRPIAFLGGVASNAGMVMAFEKVLNLAPGELRVPPHHRSAGAIGAVQHVRRTLGRTAFHGVEALEARLAQAGGEEREGGGRLRAHLPAARAPAPMAPRPRNGQRIEVWVGIDVGSISTNVVVLDRHNHVLAKRYLPTAGRPIEAVRRGLEEIGAEIGDRIEVEGAGATGSGRHLIGRLVGADVIRNEITAQATAAAFFAPDVDTVFEIGGQDSKFIRLDHGTVCDFEMNRACAAGTGSFLEEQAERLNVDLKREFSALALDAPRPAGLGDRCTVFMESDLIHHQQQGAGTPDLLAGLAYSIVHNYLNRVVGDRRIGERIVFQGGTAFNQAVVAAFRAVTGKEIMVTPHHEVTGAIGVAMLARERAAGASRFRGFDFSRRKYNVRTFVCRSCDNLCEIREVRLDGEKPLYYGSRCEKYDVERHAKASSDLPDLFAERQALLLEAGKDLTAGVPKAKGRVGIPLALAFYEFLPFWRTFFESLGFEVVLSHPTTKLTADKGVEHVAAETCFPVKVAHGHLLDLLEQRPDFLFLPSLIDSGNEDFGPNDRTAFHCPLIQAFPYIARSSLDLESRGVRVLSPPLHMQWGREHLAKTLARSGDLLKSNPREIRRALERAEAAQAAFQEALERRGREALAQVGGDRLALAVVARPYNGCDLGANLDLPRKIRILGALPIPLDMLPLSDAPLPPRWRRLYWRHGQRIMKAAKFIRRQANLFGVYVTNFGCGPDSFLTQYFRDEMAGRPFLQLEIDEHSADAGLITRCEAFLDTLENYTRKAGRADASSPERAPRVFTDHRRIYISNMAPQAQALAAAMRAKGRDAVVMAMSDEESARWGSRYTSGRECYPCLLTAGDMIRETRRSDFDRQRSAFFMPVLDGPCRFGQYGCLQRRILDRVGFDDVPIYSLEYDSEFDVALGELGPDCERRTFQGAVAIDVLEKLLLETRPYERRAGEADAWFAEAVRRVAGAVEAGPRSFWPLLPQLARERAAIARRAAERRPRIGVVGEIYVRANSFANDDLHRTIEALGGEVVATPFSEMLRYIRLVRVRRHWTRRQYRKMAVDSVGSLVMRRDERRIYAAFERKPDSPPEELFEFAAPYLDSSLQGEAILTIGKSVEMVRRLGVGGIVNAMPFTCMPGTVCSALFKRLREDHADVPVLNLVYAGQQTLNNRIRLEAFVHQAREFAERRSSS